MPFQKSSEQLTLWFCRLSFPHLWEPKPIMQQGRQIGDPRFSSLLLLTPQMEAMVREAEERLIKQSWPEGIPQGINLTRAMKPGSLVRPGDANLANGMVLSANAKADAPPQVVLKDANGNFHALQDRGRIYSGCEAHVGVGLFTTQMSANAPQINCALNLVWPTDREMPRFDNRQTAAAAFSHPDEAPPPPPAPEGTPTGAPDAAGGQAAGGNSEADPLAGYF